MTSSQQEGPLVNMLLGETLSVPERVIVAPTTGVFHQLTGHARTHDGAMVSRGDVIGILQSLGASTPVRSPFDGLLVAILAFEGERLRSGQPVAWLRTLTVNHGAGDSARS